VNVKTLNSTVLDRILAPIGRALSPEVARRLIKLRIDAKTQAKLDRLARRCNDGLLTDRERTEYETYVTAIDYVAMLQAQARVLLAKSDKAQ